MSHKMRVTVLPGLTVVLYCSDCKERVKEFEEMSPTLNTIMHASKNHKRKQPKGEELHDILKPEKKGLSIEDFPTKGEKQ